MSHIANALIASGLALWIVAAAAYAIGNWKRRRDPAVTAQLRVFGLTAAAYALFFAPRAAGLSSSVLGFICAGFGLACAVVSCVFAFQASRRGSLVGKPVSLAEAGGFRDRGERHDLHT